jgi:hypothetical protein
MKKRKQRKKQKTTMNHLIILRYSLSKNKLIKSIKSIDLFLNKDK